MISTNIVKRTSRIQASFYHLIFSLILTGAVIATVVWLWFPLDFIKATGVAKIFLLVIFVDACLGPFLTLIVYDQKKKELKRDLAIILIIQFFALAYGTYTLAKARTVYVVFAVDRFELVQANELAQEDLDLASQDRFKKLSWLGPKWIATSVSDTAEERMQISMNNLAGGADIAQLPKLYRDISSVKDNIVERSKELSELKLPPKAIAAIQNSHKEQLLGFLPLTARKKDLTVLIDRKTSKIIRILDVDPW